MSQLTSEAPLQAPACASHGHVIGQGFPAEIGWLFCALCGVFFRRESGTRAGCPATCPSCAETFTHGFQCGACGVLSLDGSRAAALRPSLSGFLVFHTTGLPNPACPGCGIVGGPAPARHRCQGTAAIEYHTDRSSCPYCGQDVPAASKTRRPSGEVPSPESTACIRVYQLAEELNIPSMRILDELKRLGVPSRNTDSTIDGDAVEQVRARLAKDVTIHRPRADASSSGGPSRPGGERSSGAAHGSADRTDVAPPIGASQAEPRVMVLWNPALASGFTVRPGDVVGREANGHAELAAAKGISRKHCRLDWDPTQATWTVTDLRSANGTFVRGRRLRKDEAASIAPGDTLTLDDLTLELQTPEAPDSADGPSPRPAS